MKNQNSGTAPTMQESMIAHTNSRKEQLQKELRELESNPQDQYVRHCGRVADFMDELTPFATEDKKQLTEAEAANLLRILSRYAPEVETLRNHFSNQFEIGAGFSEVSGN